jgi:cell wall-associated NlpC family hydrolase
VFFNPGEQVAGLPGHGGIYLGNGLMINAPHPGAAIRTEPVTGFGVYVGAKRPTQTT